MYIHQEPQNMQALALAFYGPGGSILKFEHLVESCSAVRPKVRTALPVPFWVQEKIQRAHAGPCTL